MSQLASYHNASTASSAAVMTAGGTVAPLSANGALVLFGSQTGNAESIAQVLHASCSATAWGNKSRIFQMNQYLTKHTNIDALAKETYVVFVCSTTGTGNIPDNAGRFVRQLKLKKGPWLAGVKYSILGLGDTNYEKFCEAAKNIDELMITRGATRFYPCGWADDGIGLELVVEPYQKGVIIAFNKLYEAEQSARAVANEATREAAVSVLASTPGVLARSIDDPSIKSPALSSSSSATDVAALVPVLSPSSSVDGDAKAAEYYHQRDEDKKRDDNRLAAEVKKTAAEANPAMGLLGALQEQKAAIVQAAETSTRRISSMDMTNAVAAISAAMHPAAPVTAASSTAMSSTVAPIISSSNNSSNNATVIPPSSTSSTSSSTIVSTSTASSSNSTSSTIASSDASVSSSAPLLSSIAAPISSTIITSVVTPPVVVSTPSPIVTHPSSSPLPTVTVPPSTAVALEPVANVPVANATVTAPSTPAVIAPVAAINGAAVALVGINTATIEQLTTLPKIGNTRAKLIVKNRPYADWKALGKVDGIGSAIVKGIKDLAIIDTYIAPSADEVKDQKKESKTKKSSKSDGKAVDGDATATPAAGVDGKDIKSDIKREQKACSYSVTFVADRSGSPVGGLSAEDTSLIAGLATMPRASSSPDLASLASAGKSDSKSNSVGDEVYFVSRWKNIDTEAVLRGYTPEAPFMATVTAARFLTTPASADRKVLHVELELPEGEVMYAPGDAVGIHCPNHAHLVAQILRRLKLNGSQQFTVTDNDGAAIGHIKTPCTIGDAFMYCLDVNNMRSKPLLRMLSSYCGNVAERDRLYHLASLTGKADYHYEIEVVRPNLFDVLTQYPSCMPSLAHLLEMLSPLQPRYYSITSSSSRYPTSMHIAFTLVEYDTPVPRKFDPSSSSNASVTPSSSSAATSLRRRKGLCTNWLLAVCEEGGLLAELTRSKKEQKERPKVPARKAAPPSSLANGDTAAVAAAVMEALPGIKGLPGCYRQHDGRLTIPVFMRRSTDFALPSDIAKPIIMIGPGTGVCPFRGFLQQRQSERVALATGGARLGIWRGLAIDEADEDEHTSSSSRTGRSISRPVPHAASSSPPLNATAVANAATPASAMRGMDLDEEPCDVDTAAGSAVLFFGCRRAEHDYLYRDDLEAFAADGTLSSLHVAFSRQTEKKIYVQDLMKVHAQQLISLIVDHDAYVFICGDGSRMASDVKSTLSGLLATDGGMTTSEAQAYLTSMITAKRYVQDIWS